MAGMTKFRRHRHVSGQQGTTTLLASAVLVKQSQVRQLPATKDWQLRAWEYFDEVGELRFASQWVANALSRCSLGVRVRPGDDTATDPIDLDDADGADSRARVPLQELFGGPVGHGEMLSRLAIHLTVPGESYIVGFDTDMGPGQPPVRRWLVVSGDELERGGSQTIKVRLPENDKPFPIKLADATVIRLWRPHPRRAWEADSPVRAALTVLKELVDLSAHIAATVESRLAGAGILFMPESATLPSAISATGQPLHEDPAMATLIDAMVTPIGDRDSASAVVPILVRIPDAAVGKPEYMSFASKLDEKIQQLREASIARFATIVDIPAEVLTGTGSASRWNAWKISEEAIKLHLEPLLGLICDALTTQYLWPALEALGVRDVERYVVWYDASNLVQRPNLGPEAQNLFEHGLVKTKTVVHANGFTDDDMPDAEEQARELLKRLAQKGIDPLLVQPYLDKLGIDIEVPEGLHSDKWDANTPTDGGSTAMPPGTRQRGRPAAPRRLPTRNEPLPGNTDAEESQAVVAAAQPVPVSMSMLDFAALELGALRALELAGKRLLNNTNREWRGRLRAVNPWDIHTHIPVTDPDDVLDGAYSLLSMCVPEQPCMLATIDTYVRDRLVRQQPHNRDQLMSMLAGAGCLSAGDQRAIA